MRRFLPLVLMLAASAALNGCASKHVAPLIIPRHADSFCARKEPRLTALLSIMSAANDGIVEPEHPTDASVRALVGKAGGVIGYWNEQLLVLPKTARALGETDGYARVRQAAVATAAEGATSRLLYLKVRAGSGSRWIALKAFDVQNPCVEGHRAM